MALEWADGFDTYAISQAARKGYSFSNFGDMRMASPGYGGRGQALQVGVGGVYYTACTIPVTSRLEYFFGCHIKLGGSGNFLNCNGLQLALSGSTLTINGTSYPGVLTGSWQSLWCHVAISPTAGQIAVYVDGVNIYTGTGLNTGSTSISGITFQDSAFTAANYFDDFWVFNTLGSHSNGLPSGDMLVPGLYPNADGTFRTFTPSSGAPHYPMVDQAQADDDTTYVYSPTPAADSYNIDPIPSGGVLQVHGVLVTAIHRKDDVNPKVLHVLAESGFSVAESADINVPTSYTSSSLLLGDDPNTGTQWTVAAVNAMQPGVKEIS